MFRKIRTFLRYLRNRRVNPNFHYLRPAPSIHPDLKQWEVIFAKDQPEYIPLAALRSRYENGKVMSRWPLSQEQRDAIASGADIYLELLTFNRPLQPIVLFVTDKLNVDYVKADYGLEEVPEFHAVKTQKGESL